CAETLAAAFHYVHYGSHSREQVSVVRTALLEFDQREGKSNGMSMTIVKPRAARASNHMKHINFPVTIEELRLLASLASDQLFRRQFIDPRMPGYKGSPEEVDIGKALVGRMRVLISEGSQHTASGMAQSMPSK